MPDTLENQHIAPTIPSDEPLDHIQDEFDKMKIEKKEDEDEDEVKESTEYPDRPGEPDCLYYLRNGKCGYGTNCRYNHPSNVDIKTMTEVSCEFPQREGQPDCGYYMKTGTCNYGASCKYHHPLDRRSAEHILLNTLDLPVREGEKHCPHYMRTYTCKFGRACKFNHPEPGTPNSGHSVMRPMEPSLNSSGIPYVGTFPTWPVPKPSRVASHFVPNPQAYLPFFPTSQNSFIAHQGWNNYMGSVNSISPPDMLQNFVYNSNSQGQLVTGGAVDWLTQAMSCLPQRPDQPECRYFMSNGSCKFGSNCKFHHPKERIALNVGPHGLPFRPGQDLCYDFSLYGACQYGITCKFDHPMYGTSYYYVPGARNTLVISNSTEASQSKSSKITNWIKKPETTVTDKNCQDSVNTSAEVPSKEVHDDHPDVDVADAGVASTPPELARD